ncbi:unnamed protein product [Vicia faba]|uniref:Rx N-terminal domain-containing protein n=1 Tax=Vicia faba TaxID=3906 RepID=A0AAV0ZEE9_VICFA|nr:unnamed protein product [Vicia faba]
MAELVAGAFLSSFFQVFFDRLGSSNFTDYFRRGKLDKLVEELESTLESINQVLDDAEIKQYQIRNVKKWLGDVKHAMYEADQLLDEIATDAPLKKMRAESQPSTSSNNYFSYVSAFINPFESRIKELLKNLKHLDEQKDVLELKNGSLARNEVGVSSKPLERLPTSYLVDASRIYAKSVSGEFCMRMDEDKVEGIPERTRHIWWSPQSNFVDKLQESICELKGLRSLSLEGDRSILISNTVQRDMFSRLKHLRMLSLYGCGLSELVDEISNLKLLRYLDLSYNKISSLPDTICMLYNLQTLLLQNCGKLTELPSNFFKLFNLRHLELPYFINKMPKNIGSLSNLQKLAYFIVEEQNGSDLKELEKLNHVRGTIQIKGLGKVIDPTDVTTRILKDKKYLEEIEMTFDGGREDMDGSTVESNVSVSEALQPNSNLKMLTIRDYRGNSFPNWVNGCHLPNLVSLTLNNCGLCSHLPPLGQIPSLKKLYISDCHGIKIIGKEFYNHNFKSLEFLGFDRMKNWEEWLCIEGFPLLKELSITDCPKLKRALPQHLPSLQILRICDCKMLDVSISNCDNIIVLDIWKCDRVLINELSSSLKRFTLWGNQYVEFSMDHLINCPILEVLMLDCKDFVECFSLNLSCHNSLLRLSIIGCRSSSLPFSLHLFTNLKWLDIHDCPELESFPMGDLPSNLNILGISKCPKLIAFREESGLLHLKSLVRLSIYNCPSLESLPEESLPNSLKHLFIRDCPLLKEKYKEEGGERRHTISHIPEVLIDW